MGMAASAITMRNRLRRSAEWRFRKRAERDVVFLASEQKSRDRYNGFTKLSREFSKAYPNEFKTFCMAKAEGRQVAHSAFGLPRHIPATMAAPTFTPMSI